MSSAGLPQFKFDAGEFTFVPTIWTFTNAGGWFYLSAFLVVVFFIILCVLNALQYFKIVNTVIDPKTTSDNKNFISDKQANAFGIINIIVGGLFIILAAALLWWTITVKKNRALEESKYAEDVRGYLNEKKRAVEDTARTAAAAAAAKEALAAQQGAVKGLYDEERREDQKNKLGSEIYVLEQEQIKLKTNINRTRNLKDIIDEQLKNTEITPSQRILLTRQKSSYEVSLQTQESRLRNLSSDLQGKRFTFDKIEYGSNEASLRRGERKVDEESQKEAEKATRAAKPVESKPVESKPVESKPVSNEQQSLRKKYENVVSTIDKDSFKELTPSEKEQITELAKERIKFGFKSSVPEEQSAEYTKFLNKRLELINEYEDNSKAGSFVLLYDSIAGIPTSEKVLKAVPVAAAAPVAPVAPVAAAPVAAAGTPVAVSPASPAPAAAAVAAVAPTDPAIKAAAEKATMDTIQKLLKAAEAQAAATAAENQVKHTKGAAKAAATAAETAAKAAAAAAETAAKAAETAATPAVTADQASALAKLISEITRVEAAKALAQTAAKALAQTAAISAKAAKPLVLPAKLKADTELQVQVNALAKLNELKKKLQP